MLPVDANRHKSALVAMQSITSAMLRDHRNASDRPNLLQPMVAMPSEPKDMRAINEYYFGNHLTVTEAMFRLAERVGVYVNGRLEEGRSDDPATAERGNEWRRSVLVDYAAGNSADDFSVPEPGKNGFTFAKFAQFMQSKFNMVGLSRDLELVKQLEDMLGFRMNGMSVADLMQSFIDPSGPEAQRVREVLSEGLAGQAGSKASQRMERAAEGLKSVEETLQDIKQKSSIDEVDAETIAEGRKAIEDAKMLGKVQAAAEIQDKAAEAVEEAGKAPPQRQGSREKNPTEAIEVILGLAAASVVDRSEGSAVEADGSATPEVDAVAAFNAVVIDKHGIPAGNHPDSAASLAEETLSPGDPDAPIGQFTKEADQLAEDLGGAARSATLDTELRRHALRAAFDAYEQISSVANDDEDDADRAIRLTA